jgi:hypothetical protein
MKLALVMTPRRSIVAATDEDFERLLLVHPGDVLPVELRKVRNGAHWRKFMALAAFVAENHPQFTSTAEVLDFLKYETKHFDVLITPSGSVLPRLKSIAFDAMDEAEFSRWSARARAIVFEELFPMLDGNGRERIEREVDEWLKWT